MCLRLHALIIPSLRRDGCFYYLHKPGKLYAGKHTDPDKKKRKRYALPVFARSRSRNELWPSIIEKAVVRIHE